MTGETVETVPAGWGPVIRVIAVIVAALVLTILSTVRVTRALTTEQLVPEQGRAYYVRVWVAGLSDAEGVSSTLQVLEDGRPLPLPHTLHKDVRELGSGRYSHWLNGVLLSTSDDTDPRTNGRSYALQHSLNLKPLLALLALVLLLDRRWWRNRLRWAVAHPAAMTALFFGIALAIRATTFALEQNGTFQGTLVQGVPYSDGRGWETLAAAFSEGNLEWIGGHYWTARRPLYWIVLGSVYAWTGPAVAVAQVFNLLLGALSVAFVFDAMRRVVPLPVAGLTSLALATASCGLEGHLVTMSEPLGEFCTAVSVWALVLGVAPAGVATAAPRLVWLCVAGAFLGLSNLARPLTLLAGAGLPLVFLFAPRGWSFRARIAAGGALVVGVVLTVGPWVAVQRARHGIWTISENTAEMFYAATSRADDGAWNGTMSNLAPPRPLDARVRFYADRTRHNLREDLDWYLAKVASNLVDGITNARSVDLPVRMLFCVAFLVLAGRVAHRGRVVAAMFVALLIPQWVLWPLCALWVLSRRGPIALLATYHLSTWVAMALVSVSQDHRFTHGTEWLADVLAGWTAWHVLATAADMPGSLEPAPGWERGTRALRVAAGVIAALLAGGVVIAIASSPEPRPSPIVGDERSRWIDRALAGASQEGYRQFAGRLQVHAERLRSDYRIDFTADDTGGAVGADWITETRDYPEVVMLHGDGLNAAFPGTLPPLPDETIVLVGVPAMEGPLRNQASVLEVIAVGFLDGRVIYPDPALVPAHVAHITSVVR